MEILPFIQVHETLGLHTIDSQVDGSPSIHPKTWDIGVQYYDPKVDGKIPSIYPEDAWKMPQHSISHLSINHYIDKGPEEAYNSWKSGCLQASELKGMETPLEKETKVTSYSSVAPYDEFTPSRPSIETLPNSMINLSGNRYLAARRTLCFPYWVQTSTNLMIYSTCNR
jgi:hypothetical protein